MMKAVRYDNSISVRQWVARGVMTLVIFYSLAGSALVQAHGGVPIDEDRCVFRLDGKRIHFTAYQPHSSGNEIMAETLCRKLPETTGITYFALDLVDAPLRKLPLQIDVTPLRNGTKDTELTPVLDINVGTKPQGVVTFKHDFHGAKGHYRVDVFDITDHKRGSFEIAVGERERKWVGPVISRLIMAAVLGGLVIFGQRAWRQRNQERNGTL